MRTIVRYWGSHIKSMPMARGAVTGLEAVLHSGWRVHLVCSRPPDDPRWLAPVIGAGIQVHFVGRAGGGLDPATVRQVCALCRRLRADVFHCDNIHTAPLLGAWLARVPVRVWFKRSMQPAYEECRRWTLRDRLAPGVRLSCALATQVATVSRAVRDELVAMGIRPDKVTVVNNPVYRPGLVLPDRETAREALGYTKDDLVYGAVGHAVPVKGWDVLLEAFAEVAREVPESRLLLGGSVSGPHERACYEGFRRFIEAHGLAGRVQFAGHVPDVARLLAAIDVFVLPSRSEGNSNALNEAFSAGLPCISTRVGNASYLIREGASGLLVDRVDPKGLAAAMRRLAHDEELRRQLAEGTRQPVEAPESLTAYSQAVLDLYASLLRARRVEG